MQDSLLYIYWHILPIKLNYGGSSEDYSDSNAHNELVTYLHNIIPPVSLLVSDIELTEEMWTWHNSLTIRYREAVISTVFAA